MIYCIVRGGRKGFSYSTVLKSRILQTPKTKCGVFLSLAKCNHIGGLVFFCVCVNIIIST